jgi:hypothetical protein
MLVERVELQLLVGPLVQAQLLQIMERQILVVAVVEYLLLVVAEEQVGQEALELSSSDILGHSEEPAAQSHHQAGTPFTLLHHLALIQHRRYTWDITQK